MRRSREFLRYVEAGMSRREALYLAAVSRAPRVPVCPQCTGYGTLVAHGATGPELVQCPECAGGLMISGRLIPPASADDVRGRRIPRATDKVPA